MANGKKTGGRTKGTPNKTTTAVKEALTSAFEELGGVPALVAWGRENDTEFYRLWVKVLPQEVHAELKGSVQLEGQVNVYLPDNGRDKRD